MSCFDHLQTKIHLNQSKPTDQNGVKRGVSSEAITMLQNLDILTAWLRQKIILSSASSWEHWRNRST